MDLSDGQRLYLMQRLRRSLRDSLMMADALDASLVGAKLADTLVSLSRLENCQIIVDARPPPFSSRVSH